jgi:hypothetical protein
MIDNCIALFAPKKKSLQSTSGIIAKVFHCNSTNIAKKKGPSTPVASIWIGQR